MPALDVEWCLATSRQIWAATPPSVTSRTHDAWESCEEKAKKHLQRDIDGFDATDAIIEDVDVQGMLLDATAVEWWAKTPPLVELRSNRVAQINFDNVMLMDQYLMVDIRSDASFHASGHWRASLPFDASALAAMSDVLLPFKGGNIVIMTEVDSEDDGDRFAWELVKRGYARVAVLRGAMDCVVSAAEDSTRSAAHIRSEVHSPAAHSTRSAHSYSRTPSPSEVMKAGTDNSTDSSEVSGTTHTRASRRSTLPRKHAGVSKSAQHTHFTSGQGGWDEEGVGSRRPRRPGRVMCSCYAPLTNAVMSVGGTMLRQCEFYK